LDNALTLTNNVQVLDVAITILEKVSFKYQEGVKATVVLSVGESQVILLVVCAFF
jgi:hypothetical protein